MLPMSPIQALNLLKEPELFVQLAQTILSEGTQSQKDKQACTHSEVDDRHKAKENHLIVHDPKEVT